jgi:hypothetical protein
VRFCCNHVAAAFILFPLCNEVGAVFCHMLCAVAVPTQRAGFSTEARQMSRLTIIEADSLTTISSRSKAPQKQK